MGTDEVLGWVDGPLMAFDVESTSKDPQAARLVSASVVRAVPHEVPVVRDWLVAVEDDIPEEATAVHGISTEHAREHGDPLPQVVRELVKELTEVWATGCPVVIYNAPYDLTVLNCELARVGWDVIPTLGPVIDPLVIDKHVDRYRKGSRKLADTCGHYGIGLVDAHTSGADALAAARLAWVLLHKHPEVGEMSLVELQTAQAGWWGEQQRGFAKALRTKTAAKVLAEAAACTGDDRDAKLTEIRGLLERADAVVADAERGGWPVRGLA